MSTALVKKTLLCSCLLLTACADNRPVIFHWERPNTTEQEMHKEKYICLKTNQQHYSTAEIDENMYGYGRGSSDSGMETNRGLYIACMYAKGFTKVDIKNPDLKLRLLQNK